MGFEVGAGDDPLNISFGVQRSELDTSNSAKISVWNLSPAHRAVVEQPGDVFTLRAGYGNTLPIISPQAAGQQAAIAFPIKPGDCHLLVFAE